MAFESTVLKTVLSTHKKKVKWLFSWQLQKFCRHYTYQ